jgi:hypothetical protein
VHKPFPLRHGLAKATWATVVAAAAVVVASGLGLSAGGGRYAHSQSVLVSQGADAANLIVVVLVLAAMWFARHGSLTALLLWPGSLFYLAYAYVPYLIAAPFTPLLFDDVVVFLAAAFRVAALVTGIDGRILGELFSGARAAAAGVILTVIGVLAYAGLLVTAISAFGSIQTEAAWRGHWVADWILGTPVLILGGILLWARRPFGFTAAPGLLLVSALGGVVFAAAAVVDNLTGGIRTDFSVVVVHLVISAASLAVLVWFLATARRAAGKIRKQHLRRGAAAGTI